MRLRVLLNSQMFKTSYSWSTPSTLIVTLRGRRVCSGKWLLDVRAPVRWFCCTHVEDVAKVRGSFHKRTLVRGGSLVNDLC